MFTIKTTITKDLKELRESQSNFLLSQVSNKVRTNDGLYYWGIRAKVLGNVPLIPPADYTYKSCVGTKFQSFVGRQIYIHSRYTYSLVV